ncbi:hypothetical protein LTR85_001349 [Meristemomyces frigidus]|nr:hypothetical protein LTR85_001349 [Meristemomyces frigidus]
MHPGQKPEDVMASRQRPHSLPSPAYWELRNLIYEYIACSEEPHLGVTSIHQPDLTTSGLTCQQIRGEILAVFRPFLGQQTPVVHVEVKEFEFAELARLLATLRPLGGWDEGPGAADLEDLEHWLRIRRTCPAMKHVEMQYMAAIFDWDCYDMDAAAKLRKWVAGIGRDFSAAG